MVERQTDLQAVNGSRTAWAANDGMSPHPAHSLVTWYNENRRSLPWRATADPYRILVSETMLQQTRVDTVIPYYHAFLAQFPTVADLAAAKEEAVLKQWQGLGYYSRARNLQRAAQAVVAAHGGIIPADETELCRLPGIGEYTTGAVMSIAFNRPVPAVDGNVLRVLARYFGIQRPIDTLAVKREVKSVVAAWLEAAEPRLLTQALMELGALVCVPKTPRCADCPVATGCVARRDDLTGVLPAKSPRKARTVTDVVALWLVHEGQLLVERRPNSGLLAGMWQLPAVEVEPDSGVSPAAVLAKMSAVGGRSVVPSATLPGAVAERAADDDGEFALVATDRHIFTHREWFVNVFRPVGADEPCRSLSQYGIMVVAEPFAWVRLEDLAQLAWPRVYEKILASLTGRSVRR